MRTLYNECDPRAAAWLRGLVDAGKIEPGYVNEADVRVVPPSSIPPRAHFFAGIGGWPLALDLAGCPRTLPVWTGSCPCQPFSSAGKKRGFDDDRHLWPHWFNLIRQRRPPVIFGEQVASPAGLGWFDTVQADLEGEGYSVGAADLCAAGVGAPHMRQRLYFVAVADGLPRRLHLRPRAAREEDGQAGRRREAGRALGVAHLQGPQGLAGHGDRAGQAGPSLEQPAGPAPEAGAWSDADWLPCRDGKLRPVEPGTFPLAHGVPGRVVLLRGYGNAVVPQLAAAFVRSAMEAICEV